MVIPVQSNWYCSSGHPVAYWSHVTRATRTWGGGDLDKVFSSLGAPLGHFWSAFMMPKANGLCDKGSNLDKEREKKKGCC